MFKTLEDAPRMRAHWSGAVLAALLLVYPGTAWAQCTEKVASFDLVQNEQGDIVIPALLQDTPTKMGLNFSSSWSALSARTAEKLGLPPRKILTKRAYTAFGALITHYLEIPSVKLGTLSKRMEFMAIPADARMDPQIEGWLGLSVLASFDVDIDFGNGKLNLFQPGHCADDRTVYWTKDYDVLPLSVRKFGNVDFPVQLDGQAIQMNLADGMPVGYVKMSAGNFEDAGSKNSFSALKLGRQEIRNPELTVSDDRADPCQPRFQCFGAEAGGTVSLAQLRGTHLYFAFQAKKLYVSAANAK